MDNLHSDSVVILTADLVSDVPLQARNLLKATCNLGFCPPNGNLILRLLNKRVCLPCTRLRPLAVMQVPD